MKIKWYWFKIISIFNTLRWNIFSINKSKFHEKVLTTYLWSEFNWNEFMGGRSGTSLMHWDLEKYIMHTSISRTVDTKAILRSSRSIHLGTAATSNTPGLNFPVIGWALCQRMVISRAWNVCTENADSGSMIVTQCIAVVTWHSDPASFCSKCCVNLTVPCTNISTLGSDVPDPLCLNDVR